MFTDTSTNWLPTECSGGSDHVNLRCSVLDMVLTSSPPYKQSLSPFFKSEMKVGYMGAMEVYYTDGSTECNRGLLTV